MKSGFWISFAIFCLGLIGVFGNVLTGFGLTKETGENADTHLTIALATVGSLILGSIGLIRTSRSLTNAMQERLALSKTEATQRVVSTTEHRLRSVYISLSVIICSIINLISGTISQSGRFPIVHGFFGFGLLALTIASIVFWTQVAREY